MLAPPPRHYLSTPAAPSVAQGGSVQRQRSARIAERCAFVEMKQRCIGAVAGVDGSRGAWLRHQVRQAQQPVDLWLLRGAVFAVLEGRDDDSRRTRLDLQRVLDSIFPDHSPLPPGLPF